MWDYLFKHYAQEATGNTWTLVGNLATGGDTVESANAALEADLAGITSELVPELVMIEFGANDCKWEQVEATWKAALATQIERYHTEWPAAEVWVGLPWRSESSTTIVTSMNTLAGWIADVVALYEYAHVGPDKRVYYEAGDDGATNTSDGAHPNTVGRIAVAQEWGVAVGVLPAPLP